MYGREYNRTYLIQYISQTMIIYKYKTMQGILATMGVGNKIKSCKKILINQAEKGYGVSDHYVNSL